MSKLIERMKYYCKEMWLGFKHKNINEVDRWLKEFEKENNEELGLAKEFKIKFTLSLHSMIKEELDHIKKNQNNPGICIEHIGNILRVLDKIVDQRKVRDEIIKHTISPFFKKLGYKKKARTFVKDNKKVSVYTSTTSEYYDLSFRFEVSIKGTKYENEILSEGWFQLNPNTDIGRVKEEVIKHLTNDIKPFLDKF